MKGNWGSMVAILAMIAILGDEGGVGDFGDGCNLGDVSDAGQDLGVDGVEFTSDLLAVMSRTSCSW